MNKKQTLIVNLYGGPGALKSTISAGVFTLLKLHSVDCEIPYEFAKDLIWDNNIETLHDQNYIFGNQSHRLWRLRDKVDVVIIDSPLLLSLVYKPDELGTEFINNVVAINNSYNNFNILINRDTSNTYEDGGREQNFTEAIIVDAKVKEVLLKYNQNYITTKANFNTINIIANIILKKLGKDVNYKMERV